MVEHNRSVIGHTHKHSMCYEIGMADGFERCIIKTITRNKLDLHVLPREQLDYKGPKRRTECFLASYDGKNSTCYK